MAKFANIVCDRPLSLNADLCIHSYWLLKPTEASKSHKNDSNSALRLRLLRFKILTCPLLLLGWSKNPVSSQTDKLMEGTKFSDYLGLKHYKKAKTNKKTFNSFKIGPEASKFKYIP